jgi:hypothetical protein
MVAVGMLCALFLTASPACAQSSAPETPAGRTLAIWLDAFNSGERARIESYYQQYEPAASVDRMIDFRKRTGGFDFLEVLRSEPLHVEFLVKERASETKGIGMLELMDVDSDRVTRWMLRAVPPGSTIMGFTIDAATRKRVIDSALARLNDLYVFPEIAKRMTQAVRRSEKKGEYAALTDGDAFANLLTAHLQAVSRDKHLRVTFTPVRLPERLSEPNADEVARNRNQLEQSNCGFEKLERLKGNIGYLKFNMFADPDVCGATAIAAMNFLANSTAMIFDLRDNGGGDPKMIALISTYLFAAPTHLNDIWERKGDSTQQFWTLPYVPGKRFVDGPVYVLTSPRTFSGAEEFSYNLKVLERATIVGERTGGGAHPTRGERIDDRFTIGVPFARAINPLTKTNWEGTGVEPDVSVSSADALATAQQSASDKAASK